MSTAKAAQRRDYDSKVTKQGLDCGGFFMKAGCKHVRGKQAACGGCYARLYEALHAIKEGQDPLTVVRETLAAMKADKP